MPIPYSSNFSSVQGDISAVGNVTLSSCFYSLFVVVAVVVVIIVVIIIIIIVIIIVSSSSSPSSDPTNIKWTHLLEAEKR
jgi:uncharacterized membrane protein